MITKEAIIEKAREIGFDDIGFTTAEPFDSHREYLEKNWEDYNWAPKLGIDLLNGTDARNVLPEAKSIIVLINTYFKESFPLSMEGKFGRCYLDDDRVTRDGLTQRVKEFRGYLRDNGIDSKVPFNMPHRYAAARAGLGTFGKNCLFFSRGAARKSSWNNPFTIVIDKEYPPDAETVGNGCPSWCRNVCIAACPTKALKGNGAIDSKKCISYLTYLGEDITPMELREPMGMWVYGCDRCQEVCPRNQPWMAQELPLNAKVAGKAGNFDLVKLLHMDKEYFETKIWPHMFYMSYSHIWRWKMNVARVMGNSGDSYYVPHLIRAFYENSDERIRGMIVWSLGKINSKEAADALNSFIEISNGLVKEEIDAALKR